MEVSEADRKSIYKHPLFPLLALLFERCEQATHSPDGPFVASLKADVQAFIQHQQQNSAQFESRIGDMPEVDTLMLRAIQILRIHLLELEKVNELCKDFCTRYISCLRMKMQNEQLLHVDSFDSDCVPASTSHQYADSSPGGSVAYLPAGGTGPAVGPGVAAGGMRGYGGRDVGEFDISGRDRGKHMIDNSSGMTAASVHHQQPQQQQQLEIHQHSAAVNNSRVIRDSRGGGDGGTVGGGYSRGSVDTDVRHAGSNNPGGGYNNSSLAESGRSYNDGRRRENSYDDEDNDDDDDDRNGDETGNSVYHRSNSGNGGTGLPQHAADILKDWLFKHLVHPYPTEEEKTLLLDETGLSIQQVNSWFMNARHKLLQQADSGRNSALAAAVAAEMSYSQQRQQGSSEQHPADKPITESSRYSPSLERPSSNGVSDKMRSTSSFPAGVDKRHDSPSRSSTPTSTTTFDSEQEQQQQLEQQQSKLLQNRNDNGTGTDKSTTNTNESILHRHGNNVDYGGPGIRLSPADDESLADDDMRVHN